MFTRVSQEAGGILKKLLNLSIAKAAEAKMFDLRIPESQDSN